MLPIRYCQERMETRNLTSASQSDAPSLSTSSASSSKLRYSQPSRLFWAPQCFYVLLYHTQSVGGLTECVYVIYLILVWMKKLMRQWNCLGFSSTSVLSKLNKIVYKAYLDCWRAETHDSSALAKSQAESHQPPPAFTHASPLLPPDSACLYLPLLSPGFACLSLLPLGSACLCLSLWLPRSPRRLHFDDFGRLQKLFCIFQPFLLH